MNQGTNPFDKQNEIPGVKNIIAISSGKGGVGKSSVSSNLAVALKKQGLKVGLLDADIYGPSIPRMFGCLGQKPEVTNDNRIIPLQRLGISLMSIGFLVDDNTAVIWRGPMLFKAIEQFFRDVEWGELDFLIIDLPPGTGDVQLSVAQKVPVTAAIAVTTPQNVALMDVKRAIDMFDKIKVPVLGVVENMAYFIPPGQSEKVQLFPKGELDQYLQQKNLQKLAEIPFNPALSLAGEAGIPLVESYPESTEALAFTQLAKKLMQSYCK